MRLSLEWIKRTARLFPHWFFLIKTRPYHEHISIPGSEDMQNYPNIKITHEELKNLLNWDNLKVVVACGSTGLYVSAGIGKYTLRFLPSKYSTRHRIIDEITVPIESVQSLIETLRKLSDSTNGKPKKGSYHSRDVFPHKRHVLDYMEARCFELLNG